MLIRTFLLLLLLCPLRAESQRIVCDSIIVKYYLGGDYRDEKIKGARDEFFERVYKFDASLNVFFSEYLFVSNRVLPFSIDKGEEVSISKDSTLEIYDYLEISIDHVDSLLSYSIYDNYDEIILIDTIDVFGSPYVQMDTLGLIKDYSIEDYIFSKTSFQNDCRYYKHKYVEEGHTEISGLDCDRITDYSAFLEELTKSSSQMIHRSSFLTWVSVRFFIDKSEVEFFQKYPGRINTTWWILKKDMKSKRVINPKINMMLSLFLQKRYTPIERLAEFQDGKLLVWLYYLSKE